MCWEINSFPFLKIMEELKEDNMKRSKIIRKIICELYLIAPHIKNKKRSHWEVSKKQVLKLINNAIAVSNTTNSSIKSTTVQGATYFCHFKLLIESLWLSWEKLWNDWATFENIFTVAKRVDISKMMFSVNDMRQCKFEHPTILISRNMESGDTSFPSVLLATS